MRGFILISAVLLSARALPLPPASARVLPPPTARSAALPAVTPNDNRRAAGARIRDTISVRLVAQMATWRPDGPKGKTVDVATLGEEGKTPSIPAPLLRVPTGSSLAVTVRNALTDSTIYVSGLWNHPSDGKDTIAIAPGESRTVRFAAGSPGTYLYGATIGRPLATRADGERETALGAFVVDAAGPVPSDRIFVMNIWGNALDSTHYSNALTINGLSWPSTEHLEATSGDTLRWRVINATNRGHPMHLHGFYFTVTNRGDAMSDTARAANARFDVVTELLRKFTTMSMQWSPTRPGNWLFHCHIAAHVIPEGAQLLTSEMSHDMSDDVFPDPSHSMNAGEHMRGLILGISVKPHRGELPEARRDVRALRLEVRDATTRADGAGRYTYVLGAGTIAANTDAARTNAAGTRWRAGGPLLILRRGQPTDVTVVNHLRESTAVHWHGLELESWSDGVAGWSGTNAQAAPAIAPADSFVAHLSSPRAGTFIYHTHLGDRLQLSGGLYGPLIVLAEGETFDPALDHIFTAGVGGQDEEAGFVVNGDRRQSPPLELRAGTTHRLRFIGIAPNNSTNWEMRRDSTVIAWRALAKDGADFPAALQQMVPARALTTVGETRDFLITPEPGEYMLSARNGANGRWSQRLIVRP